jgi:hypothetical protein
MIQKAELRILKHEDCERIITDLEGIKLRVPQNYMCTNNNPFVHLEKVSNVKLLLLLVFFNHLMIIRFTAIKLFCYL